MVSNFLEIGQGLGKEINFCGAISVENLNNLRILAIIVMLEGKRKLVEFLFLLYDKKLEKVMIGLINLLYL